MCSLRSRRPSFVIDRTVQFVVPVARLDFALRHASVVVHCEGLAFREERPNVSSVSLWSRSFLVASYREPVGSVGLSLYALCHLFTRFVIVVDVRFRVSGLRLRRIQRDIRIA